jgi:hypothetical protein
VQNAASTIYDIIAAEWDTSVCGGGVWWSKAHTYKNAITNELFLLTSAAGYNRLGQQKYLDNANKVWTWCTYSGSEPYHFFKLTVYLVKNSGMRNSNNLWNDGLTSDCKNNGQVGPSYIGLKRGEPRYLTRLS